MRQRYCRSHGRTFFYFCPDCTEDIKQEERRRKWSEVLERTIWLPEVSNPTLPEVKMFLADVINKISALHRYDEHNCAHFAQEIQDTASRLGTRCGYVVIAFGDSEIGHAIVAFETDCGLKFFEPQTADEVHVMVGHCYSARTEGLSADNVVDHVTIRWNDGTRIQID